MLDARSGSRQRSPARLASSTAKADAAALAVTNRKYARPFADRDRRRGRLATSRCFSFIGVAIYFVYVVPLTA